MGFVAARLWQCQALWESMGEVFKLTARGKPAASQGRPVEAALPRLTSCPQLEGSGDAKFALGVDVYFTCALSESDLLTQVRQ